MSQASMPQWLQLRTGDATQDWPLLQQLSCEHAEQFWSAVLRELGIRFHKPPTRILEDNVRQPDEVRWMPGELLWETHAGSCSTQSCSAQSCLTTCLPPGNQLRRSITRHVHAANCSVCVSSPCVSVVGLLLPFTCRCQ